jgi:hypothetical protein
MATTVHAGDVGTTVEVTVTKDDGSALDLSGASIKRLKFKLSKTLLRDGEFVSDGVDGKIKYTTIVDDDVFKKAGTWKIQAYVELTGGKWNTDIAQLIVDANL